MNPPENIPNILEVMGSTIDIMESRITEMNLELHPPDILLQPNLGELRMFDFDKAELGIREGYRVMKDALPKLLNPS